MAGGADKLRDLDLILSISSPRCFFSRFFYAFIDNLSSDMVRSLSSNCFRRSLRSFAYFLFVITSRCALLMW